MSIWILRLFPTCLALLTLAATTAPVLAGPPAGQAQAVVTEMCGGCVKGITAKLKELPDVVSVTCDVKTKTVTITPKDKAKLFAKALWEALEAAGKTPIKVVTAEGTFTSKPKS